MIDYLQFLIYNMPLVVFFLLVSFLIGCATALYAFLLQKLKTRHISYAIPFIIVVLWVLWVSSQEIPGPTLAAINFGYMFLYYPMIVVSLLPLASYFIKLDKSWAVALIVATAVMFISLVYGGLRGEQVAVMPSTSQSYIDSLAKNIISLISIAVYVIAGYMVGIAGVKALSTFSIFR